ncbi:protein DEHYDRATION-INDUCED 19-like protein 2-like isoform X1 [Iris pallida]|uniref:Protein DEHYDRATION-INDUCED 19-like protein 2-like isoform X1 n=1 Tax=Iris pallida TaxID=29817 RepID=A0AAX6EUU9_IRIPA|nr:protein DEHYDRATION-INDUCED 19-like protein 2-like isoform X1 [Iris pallida]
MESDSWTRFSKRHQSALQSRYDLYLGFEDAAGGDDEPRAAEFPCPFCGDDFDIVGLCCHIDEEHPAEAKNGVCPVCAARVGMDMVAHITMQHGNFFKISFLAFLKEIPQRFIRIPFNTFFVEKRAKRRESTSTSWRVIHNCSSIQCST